MTLHEGAAEEYFGSETGEFYAACECGWNTFPAKILTMGDAEYALAQHIETQRLLEQPLAAALIKVVRDHVASIPIGGGGLQCSCGWFIVGYPIGAKTAWQLHQLHYMEKLKEAFRASVFTHLTN